MEGLPIVPYPDIDVLPVVEPRALYFLVIEREAEGSDEMEGRSGGEAGSARVAGVPVNFRMDERDVDRHSAYNTPDANHQARARAVLFRRVRVLEPWHDSQRTDL